MALIYEGMACAICDQSLDIHGAIFATTHFITDESDPLWRFSDAAMHYSCFEQWEHRGEFVKKYNATMGTMIWDDGTRQHMKMDGSIESVPADFTHVAAARTKRLGMIISNEAASTLKHLEELTKAARQGYGNPKLRRDVRDWHAAHRDPRAVIDLLMLLFKEKFADVTLVDDFQALMTNGLDIAAVVDLRVVDGTSRHPLTAVDIRVHLFDDKACKIGEARGTARRDYLSDPESPGEDSLLNVQAQAVRGVAAQLTLLCK